VAAELIADLERVYQRKKAANKELTELFAATGSTLMALHGIGPSGAVRLLVEVGDITRFPNRAHVASWNGTAPIDASSGDQIRHRLSRAGNRQINRVLHIMATVQPRNPPRDGLLRPQESQRQDLDGSHALPERRRSDIVYRHMVDDAIAHAVTGPGGHWDTTTDSSVTNSHSHAGSSEKSLPGPATTQPRTPRGGILTRRGVMSARNSAGPDVLSELPGRLVAPP
jgi:transposase